MFTLDVLLAEANHLYEMGERFRSGDGDMPRQLLTLGVGLIVLVVVVAVIIRLLKLREQRCARNPAALFNDLCRAHGLDARQARALRQLAARAKLPHAASVFLAPELFAPRAQASDEERAELETLRDRLFARRLEEEEAAVG